MLVVPGAGARSLKQRQLVSSRGFLGESTRFAVIVAAAADASSAPSGFMLHCLNQLCQRRGRSRRQPQL
eukprot:11218170-Lingulodinium_polyedra.AAC.1